MLVPAMRIIVINHPGVETHEPRRRTAGRRGYRSRGAEHGLIQAGVRRAIWRAHFRAAKSAPMGRPLLPDDYTAVARFLVSSETGMISGVTIPVYGEADVVG